MLPCPSLIYHLLTTVTEQLALTEAGYCTGRLIQHFPIIEGRGKDDWEESLTLTCCPDACEIWLGAMQTEEGLMSLSSPLTDKGPKPWDPLTRPKQAI